MRARDMLQKSIATKSGSAWRGSAPSTISARDHSAPKRALTTRRNLRWRSAKRLATSRLCLRVTRCAPARPGEFPAGQTISFEACRTFSRNDDAGLVAGNFRRCRILAAQEFEEHAGARAAIGCLHSYAQEKHENVKNFRVLHGGEPGALRLALPYFRKRFGQFIVQRAGQGRVRGPFKVDAAAECSRGFGERPQGVQCLRIVQVGMHRRKLQNGESDPDDDILALVDRGPREAHVRKGNAGRIDRLAVLFFVVMRRNQVRTIRPTINGDFALGAAADGADGFPFCRAVALRLSLRADRTTHQFSFCATRASVRKPSSGARWSGHPNGASSSLPNAERTGVRESLAGRGSGPAEQVLP